MTDLSQPPFVYELARRAGYEVNATSSTNPDWFGIDRQALRPQLALGRYQGATDPDGQAVADFVRYLRTAHASPFFSFLFLNGTHFPYYVPLGSDFFQPQLEQIDLSDPHLQRHREEIINRYRNSLHRIDQLVGEILRALREREIDGETILAITGDHGESFWDDERLSHTSLLSAAQLHVPLILSIPGQGPRRIESVSSHVDVIPTLLDAAGIALDPSTYSDGHSLLSHRTDEALAAQFSLGYPRDFALIRGQSLVRFRAENGRLRILGAEGTDGRFFSPDETKKTEEQAWPAILKVFRYTSRWWPTGSSSS
jgi:membrane-anchored protein YejM (alkaline phosphatase superfamily)